MAETKAWRSVEGEKTAIVKAIGNPSSASGYTLFYDLRTTESNERVVSYWVEWSVLDNPSYVTRRTAANSISVAKWEFATAAEAIKILQREFNHRPILYCNECKSGQKQGPCRCEL